ncbi:MAG: hypothetical protein ACI957_004305 [Verrucomicrobiales bacterium]|jgi:hypothetical protein
MSQAGQEETCLRGTENPSLLSQNEEELRLVIKNPRPQAKWSTRD